MKQLKLDCESIDILTYGGIPTGDLTCICGPYQAGKSIMTFQYATMCTRDTKYGGFNKKALIIDTENWWEQHIVDTWHNYLRDRWNDLPKKSSIEVIQVFSLQELCKLFGLDITLGYKSTDTKYPKILATVVQNPIENSTIYKRISKGDIGFLAIDSISSPTKSAIPSEMPNYPARASIMNPLLARLKYLANKFDIIVCCTNHITKGVYTGLEPHGGIFLKHATKYFLILLPATKGKGSQIAIYGTGTKRVYRWRWKGKPDLADYALSSIKEFFKPDIVGACLARIKTNYGYVSVSPKTIKYK